jgi:hypothetical protein
VAGDIRNESSKTLWVIETDTGSARAHQLNPGLWSPASVDADGVKAVDGTPISGHGSWWKVTDISTATVKDAPNGGLQIDCLTCPRVGENQFGTVYYVPATEEEGWGRAPADTGCSCLGCFVLSVALAGGAAAVPFIARTVQDVVRKRM